MSWSYEEKVENAKTSMMSFTVHEEEPESREEAEKALSERQDNND